MFVVEKTTCSGEVLFIGAYNTKAEAEAVADKVSFSYVTYVGEMETH